MITHTYDPNAWQLVPKESTQEMIKKAQHALFHYLEQLPEPERVAARANGRTDLKTKHTVRWRAMLAAAPAPPVAAGDSIGGVKATDNAALEVARAASALLNNLWVGIWSGQRTHEENWKEFDRACPGAKWLHEALSALSAPTQASAPSPAPVATEEWRDDLTVGHLLSAAAAIAHNPEIPGDDRIRQLMKDVGYENSLSLCQAFRQIVIETRTALGDSAWKEKATPPTETEALRKALEALKTAIYALTVPEYKRADATFLRASTVNGKTYVEHAIALLAKHMEAGS